MEFAVQRCRLFNYTPHSIQCIASCDVKEDRSRQRLAVGREDGSIEIIHSTLSGYYTEMVIPGSSKRTIEDLIWYEDHLLSADLQGFITEYDLATGSAKYSEDSFGGAVWCLAAGHKVAAIACGCEDGSLKIFHWNESQIIFKKSMDKQEGRILSCAFHPNNETIVSGSVDVIRIWSFKSGHAIQRIRLDDSKNMETIVWAVKVLRNHTIVSGDSRGKVQFWNGKNGTLLKGIHTHQADVLALCLSPDEKSVYAAGVDPKVIELSYIENETDELAMDTDSLVPVPLVTGTWIKGPVLQSHTHDVRSLVIAGNMLVSGGVDTCMLLRSIVDRTDRRIRKVLPFPHTGLVHCAKKSQMMLLQYPAYLDIWKLGVPVSTTGNIGEEIVLEKQPRKLVQLKCPPQEYENISCSAMSNCGHWVAYSTRSSFRLFKLEWKEDDPYNISVSKVRVVWFSPSHTISFVDDSSYMITASLKNKVAVTKLDDDAHVHLYHVFQANISTDSRAHIHLLATSSCNTFLAVGDISNTVDVYDLKKCSLLCSLPGTTYTPTAIAFKPSTSLLVVVYQNYEVVEYDVTKKSYTKWCRTAHQAGMNLLACQPSRKPSPKGVQWNSFPILNITFSASKPELIMLASSKAVWFIDQSKDITKELSCKDDAEKITVLKESPALKCCQCFQSLLYARLMDDGKSILVVERPWKEIFENLPPTLYQKKFGT